MIVVTLNKINFDYDIYSLVKAFYPKEELAVIARENYREEDYSGKEISFFIEIDYGENYIEIRLEGQDTLRTEGVDFNDRPDAKNKLKLLIYNMLSEKSGKCLPWGTLTGIRPTKIAYKMIEKGAGYDEVASYMRDTYLCSDQKIRISYDIAKSEFDLISSIDLPNSYSLYIGIPFCPTTCAYCSFTSYAIGQHQKFVKPYLEALEKELRWVAENIDKELTTIYIGGGTPTALDEEALEQLLKAVNKYFPVKELKEFTVEAGRPDSITTDKLKIMKENGVSRISINPQTMNEKTLKLIGRRHKPQEVIDIYKEAVAAGFDDINMDIILGLPEETIEEVRYTMEEIKKLAPKNLTVHSLALKRAASLNIEKESYEEFLMENSQANMDLTAEYAKEMGLKPYYLYRQQNIAGNLENIGYAAEGYAGMYNILIMEEVQDIVACGCGTACKKIIYGKGTDRCENVKDVALYIEKIDEMIERKRQLFN